MGKVKKNLLASILLLVVMGIFAVLTIFVVVDAVNKKYYEDLNVDYEVQEEAPNIILTFARHEGSEVNNTTTKVVLNEEKDKFRLDGIVPEVTDGDVTNLDAITNENGGEFYFFSTNPAFINVQETPEDPSLIFSETDIRYYISTEENPIWYDVPTENVFTLYSVFLTPNVHNADFEDAPLNTITNAIVSHDVVNLPEDAFKGSSSSRPSALTTILLPETLQSIGDYSFQYCGNLISITIPDGVTSIGIYAFYDCSSLTSITIPEGVTSIGELTFRDCSSLTSIIIPSSVTSIGERAFYSCSSLSSIIIPSSVTSIGSYAFRYCSSLTSITIPESMTSIGSDAFYDCDSLQFNEYENGLYLGNENNLYLALIDTTNSDITSFTINQNCKIIAGGVFYNCSSLTSIIIPSSVTSIGSSAFGDCSSLVSITIPRSVTSIGGGAFSSCSSLESVTFERDSQLESIGDYAFDYCDSLTSITIPESVTSIGSSAFEYCVKLSSITLPEGLTTINDKTFYGCDLMSITIPSSVTSIGDHAFYLCGIAEVINLSDLNITVGDRNNGYVGFYAIDIRDETDGSGIYYLGDYDEYVMYEDLKGHHYLLKYLGAGGDIVLPTLEGNQVYFIHNSAFFGYTNLTSITIPSSVTSIGDSAFYGCSSLTSIVIPRSITSIGYQAFYNCSNLTIYCERSGRPSGWDSSWNHYRTPVYWGLNVNWVYVDGVPRPIE